MNSVSESNQLTLGKVNLAVALGILLTESETPVPQPLGILGTIARPDGAGVLVVTALVDEYLGNDVGLYTIAQTREHQHLNCLDGHLDDMAVGQRLCCLYGVCVGVEDVHGYSMSVSSI